MLPRKIVELVWRLPWTKRPDVLAQLVEETPEPGDLRSGVLSYEMRDGHLKWIHLRCPKCGVHIQLPAADGSDGRWRSTVCTGLRCLRRSGDSSVRRALLRSQRSHRVVHRAVALLATSSRATRTKRARVHPSTASPQAHKRLSRFGYFGGEGEIRTPGQVAPSADFRVFGVAS